MLLKTTSLPPDVNSVVCHKATEAPFSGQYTDYSQPGTYLCRQCGLGLFRAQSKFHSGCGWPSFDQEIAGAVKQVSDKDGMRTEILCARCDAHLGHVFHGENFTAKNLRHCVNSLSLDFVTDPMIEDTEEAIVAAGCFWGVEYCLKRIEGVVKTEVGYTGGAKQHPTYKEVCTGTTGHIEAVRILYDPSKLSYETLLGYFFKIHDPTQANGQGPDIGSQYLSAIFYHDATQKEIAEKVINSLQQAVCTRVLPANSFWSAEDYHQDYYDKKGEAPYCHRPITK